MQQSPQISHQNPTPVSSAPKEKSQNVFNDPTPIVEDKTNYRKFKDLDEKGEIYDKSGDSYLNPDLWKGFHMGLEKPRRCIIDEKSKNKVCPVMLNDGNQYLDYSEYN
jgi:hypothetical protein